MQAYGYPVRFEPNGEGGFVGAFRDVPEALTEVWPGEDKKSVALDALITAIDFYIEDQRKFPNPSKAQKGEEVVELPASVVSKILLLNLMVEQNVRPADLAKKMGVRPQQVTRILDLHHTTKIDTVSHALRALGKNLCLSLS